MNLNTAFSIRLADILAKKNISKYRLEPETGLTHSTLRHIFNGNNRDVKLSTIAKVAIALGMTLAEFLNDPIFDLAKIDL